MAPRKGTQYVPAAPFAEWLNHRLGVIAASLGTTAQMGARAGDLQDACELLAAEVGWTEVSVQSGVRKLYRFRHQLTSGSIDGIKCEHRTDMFVRSLVEEALHSAGVCLGELYPYEALVDEFVMEYDVPRDQAQHLADAWIERTWHTVWERAGLFVLPEHRRQRYCRDCHRTTRVFAGVCEECMAPDHVVLVGAVAA